MWLPMRTEPVYEAVTTDMLRVRYAVDIEALSLIHI